MHRHPSVTELGEPVASCCASPMELFSKAFSLMNEFRQEGKFCDVNIVVDDTTFPCHRLVLATASTFFKTMFGGQFKESEEKEIHLKNLSAECFTKVLEFFYTKELKIDSSNSYELLEASLYFGEVDMENCCVEYMVSHFPQKHIVETCIYAKSNNRKQLYDTSILFIARNWSQLCKEDRLLEISPEIFEDVVKRKCLIQTLDDVANFIPRWKEKQNADTSKVEKLLQTLEHRGSGTLTACLFVHLFKYDSNDSYDSSCRMVAELTYDESSSEWKQERVFYKKESYEINVAANGHLFTFFWNCEPYYAEFRVRKSLYDISETLSKPPIDHVSMSGGEYSMAAIRDTIYFYDALRGRTRYYELLTDTKDIEKSNKIYAYIYDIDKWFSVPKPQYELLRSCITSVNNQLYLIGGAESVWGSESKCYAQCYDHRSPNWIVLPEMSNARGRPAACSYDEKVYVLGGYPNDCSLEVYDPKAGRWQVLQSCSREREKARFVSYDDKLWAFPIDGSGFVECYNPVTNSWSSGELWNESYDAAKMHNDGDESENGREVYLDDAFVW